MAWGAARHNADTHITTTYLMTLDSFDMVCDKNGWQIARYLSAVKAVIVSTVALAEVSAANP